MHILDDQIKEQILSDGSHFELSTMYQAIILEDILDLIYLNFTNQNSQQNFLLNYLNGLRLQKKR